MPQPRKTPAGKPKARGTRRPGGPAWAKDFTHAGIEIIDGPAFDTMKEAEAFSEMHRFKMAAVDSKGGAISGGRRTEKTRRPKR